MKSEQVSRNGTMTFHVAIVFNSGTVPDRVWCNRRLRRHVVLPFLLLDMIYRIVMDSDTNSSCRLNQHIWILFFLQQMGQRKSSFTIGGHIMQRLLCGSAMLINCPAVSGCFASGTTFRILKNLVAPSVREPIVGRGPKYVNLSACHPTVSFE